MVVVLIDCIMIINFLLIRRGPCKMRNDTEMKRNETKQIEIKRNKSK